MRLSKVVEGVFEDGVLGSALGRITLGVGALFLAPVLFPQFRPLGRGLMRAGLAASDKVKEIFGEAKEQWADLAAEARAEMEAEAVTEPAPAEEAPPAPPARRRRAATKKAKAS
jgi:hypothetical protein